MPDEQKQDLVQKALHVDPTASKQAQGENAEANSVFKVGYVESSKDLNLNQRVSGVFSVEANKTFWKFIPISISEVHEEKLAVHETLADSVVVFSTGSKPVQISLTGYILLGGSDDHLYEFLTNYVDSFRARHLSTTEKTLSFVSEDTKYALILEAISLTHSTDYETYVGVTMSGLAYAYSITDSREKFSLGYFGDTPDTRTKPKKKKTEKKQETKTDDEKKPELVGPPVPPAIEEARKTKK